MTFLWKSQDEVQIPGFMNIEHRQWVRAVRRAERENFGDVWGDTPEGLDGDIFDLRRHFGEESYIVIEEEWIQEDWAIEEEREEQEEEQEWRNRNGFIDERPPP
ncbi:hypothetical protein CAJAP_08878 [Camponotus japonicus]